MKRISTLFVIFLLPISCGAGWFDKEPKTYDECVLDKMKGQSKTMLPFAKRACRSVFPETSFNPDDWEMVITKPESKWVVSEDINSDGVSAYTVGTLEGSRLGLACTKTTNYKIEPMISFGRTVKSFGAFPSGIKKGKLMYGADSKISPESIWGVFNDSLGIFMPVEPHHAKAVFNLATSGTIFGASTYEPSGGIITEVFSLTGATKALSVLTDLCSKKRDNLK